ncbi:MAG: FG-GAP repeat domain-containing protein, partial [Verrucomicrobiales bacterium]
YGLSWWEQVPGGFKEHLIMGDRATLNRYGLAFSELHSITLADIDGDGLKDVVTGKTYWSHHKQALGWDDGAVVYWFKLVRRADGVDWLPMLADPGAGIGRQVVVKDLNRDGLADMVVGGMVGGSVLLQRREEVGEAAWLAAQPRPIPQYVAPPLEGPPAPIEPKTGQVPGALEAETSGAKPSRGKAAPQNMANFRAAKWSGGAQLFWRGGADGDTIEFELPVAEAGEYQLETVFTRAPDYAVVQLALDGDDLGDPIDLYHFSKVTTTGVIERALGLLEAGAHTLTIRITGVNVSAQPDRLVGLDYVRVVKAE